jgi:hypothetical protein
MSAPKTKVVACKKLKKGKYSSQVKLIEEKLKKKVKIYQIKITLKDISPKIWRRFAVPSDMSLHDLSKVIFEVMGWGGYHLYAFHIGGLEYGLPDDEFDVDKEIIDDRDVSLKDVLKEKQQFEYEYDFGDDWRHELFVEKITDADPKITYPVCLEGKRACPPEDCGSVSGYEELLEALKDLKKKKYEELVEWAGNYNPEEFDLSEVNGRIRSIDYQDDKCDLE